MAGIVEQTSTISRPSRLCAVRSTLRVVGPYLVLVLAIAPFVFPLYWLGTAVFKPSSSLLQLPIEWWPKTWTMKNLNELFQTQGSNILQYAKNTAYICLFVTVATTISSSLAAYAFSQVSFRGRDALFWTVIVTLILPTWVTIVPQYELYRWLGWLGTLRPLTWPSLVGDPFTIFLLRQYMRGIPRELGEAARIDGANEFQIYLRIILPTARSALAVAAVFAFVQSYNDFFTPLVYLNNEQNYTLALGVYQFVQLHGAPDVAQILTYTALVVTPLIVVFAIAQRWIVNGIRLTSWK